MSTTASPPAGVMLYSVKEASRATSLSPSFLRALISSGAIPVVRVGRLVRLRPNDIAAYIDAHTSPAHP